MVEVVAIVIKKFVVTVAIADTATTTEFAAGEVHLQLLSYRAE